jgi:hypothetical protein
LLELRLISNTRQDFLPDWADQRNTVACDQLT